MVSIKDPSSCFQISCKYTSNSVQIISFIR